MTEKKVVEKVTALRGFGLTDNNGRAVDTVEFSDGSVQFSLITERAGLESLITPFRLTPAMFKLLSESMLRAAHDSSVWMPIPAKLQS